MFFQQEITDAEVSTRMRTVNRGRRHCYQIACSAHGPPVQPAQLLQAYVTFLAVKLNACMPGSCTKKRKVIFFMNINEQTVSRNLKCKLCWLVLISDRCFVQRDPQYLETLRHFVTPSLHSIRVAPGFYTSTM